MSVQQQCLVDSHNKQANIYLGCADRQTDRLTTDNEAKPASVINIIITKAEPN